MKLLFIFILFIFTAKAKEGPGYLYLKSFEYHKINNHVVSLFNHSSSIYDVNELTKDSVSQLQNYLLSKNIPLVANVTSYNQKSQNIEGGSFVEKKNLDYIVESLLGEHSLDMSKSSSIIYSGGFLGGCLFNAIFHNLCRENLSIEEAKSYYIILDTTFVLSASVRVYQNSFNQNNYCLEYNECTLTDVTELLTKDEFLNYLKNEIMRDVMNSDIDHFSITNACEKARISNTSKDNSLYFSIYLNDERIGQIGSSGREFKFIFISLNKFKQIKID